MTPESGMGVLITGKEVYDAVLSIKDTVTRMEQKLGDLSKTVAEHDVKIEDLTKKYYLAGGIGGIAGSIVVAAIPVIIRFMQG